MCDKNLENRVKVLENLVYRLIQTPTMEIETLNNYASVAEVMANMYSEEIADNIDSNMVHLEKQINLTDEERAYNITEE